MIGNISSLRRQVKNVACNYSDAQVKVREATSNDPWGPSSSLMSEIADMTYNTMAFTEIMQIIWKRLNDHGKNWRHVYKSLVLLDYLIKVGSEKVAHQCRENIFAIQTLKDFQYIEENKDQGMNVREKAKQLVTLLKDDERLKNERARALMAKKRFAQNGVGIGSDGSTHEFRRSDTYHGDYDAPSLSNCDGAVGNMQIRHRRGSEFEDCRPSSVGEEELQLQIALALSKEEAQREEETRKGDDLRLQMAITESRHNDSGSPVAAAAASFNSMDRPGKGPAIDDLLSLQPAFGGNDNASASAFNDPWNTKGHQSMTADPWGASVSKQSLQNPSSSMSVGLPASNDPWATSSVNTSFQAQSGLEGQNHAWPANGAFGTNDPHDPFAPVNNGIASSPAAVRPLTAEPWGLDNTKISLPAQHTGGSDSGLPKSRNVKTPEHFLGENSVLVNLDNLMGPPKSNVAGMPPKSSNNPFMGSSFGTTIPVANSNPFASQQRPSSTLNEMRSAGSQQPSFGPGTNVNSGAWGMPQPLQPASTTSTNPFL